MDFQGESLSLTAPLLALSMVNVDPDKFKGVTFGVSSLSLNLDPEVRDHWYLDNALTGTADLFCFVLFLVISFTCDHHFCFSGFC